MRSPTTPSTSSPIFELVALVHELLGRAAHLAPQRVLGGRRGDAPEALGVELDRLALGVGQLVPVDDRDLAAVRAVDDIDARAREVAGVQVDEPLDLHRARRGVEDRARVGGALGVVARGVGSEQRRLDGGDHAVPVDAALAAQRR